MGNISNDSINQLELFNSTYREYPRNRTIIELFEEQAAQNPDNIAVKTEEEELSYAALNNRSNQFANSLRSNMKDCQRANIAVVMNSSIHYMVSILSILKAGCTYVPIDPQYPIERIRFILAKCNVKTVITQSQYLNQLSDDEKEIDFINISSFYFTDSLVANSPSKITSQDIAYIMFTSGTTGQPKGVMIRHSNIAKLVLNTTYVTFTSQDKVLQAGAIVFDASTFEIWGALLNGAALCLIEKDTLLNTDKFCEAIIRYQISIMCLTTPLFIQLVQMDPTIFRSVSQLIVGGDVLPAKSIERLLASCKNIQFLNGYGPTECTTFATALRVKPGELPTIGGPIDNTTIYILDDHKNRLPSGKNGEIYIGGEGVGAGYINEPLLTSACFIENPHKAGEVIYKTGDLGRWDSNGNIEYLGRIDSQIKIRGHRVELSEIELIIAQIFGVSDAYVFHKKEHEGEGHIYAFFTSEMGITEKEVWEYMNKKLPKYMHPRQVVKIDKVPLNINHKIDKDKLYALAQEQSIYHSEIKFSNDTERELYQIWKNVLNIDDFGPDDDFFDLGGHSLLAIKLITELQSKFEMDFSLSIIYKYPAVSKMCLYIQEKKNQQRYVSIAAPIEADQRKKMYLASDTQKRMYIINHYEDISTAYNVVACYKLSGILDTDKLKAVLGSIIQRHDILRTSFEYSAGVLYQKVADHVTLDLTIMNNVPAGDFDNRLHTFITEFDLSGPALIKFGLFQMQSGEFMFVINAHHIIIDRASIDILLKEFTELYNDQELPEISYQFSDYTERFSELESKGYFTDSMNYWKNTLKGDLPALEIPSDYIRPHSQNFEGERYTLSVHNLTEKIDQYLKKSAVTRFAFYTAVFNVLLMKYCGEEDIILGSPVTSRLDKQLNNTMGLFTNTIVIRNQVESSCIFTEFLNQVKSSIISAFDHQYYPFERIINDSKIERDMSRNPLYNVMILLDEEIEYQQYKIKNLKIEPYPITRKTAKCDLTFKVRKNLLEFEYCKKIFSTQNISKLAEHLLNIVSQVISNPDIKIGEINILSVEEQKQIVETFSAPRKNKMTDFNPVTLKELFERKVSLQPDAVAVKVKDQKITYKQLNAEANKLANFLIEIGVEGDTRVGILMDSSYYMILGIVSIFKAGGAFVPIDPETPESRIHYILNNSDIRILLTTASYRSIPEKLHMEIPVFVLDESDETLKSYSSHNPKENNDIHHLAYMIYTSGSTGVPKGVLVEQKSLINYLYWFKEESLLTNVEDSVLLSSFSFDLGYTVLFSSLFFGGTLHLLSKREYLNPQNVLTYFYENNIKLLKITPSLFSLICQDNMLNTLEQPTSLRLIVLGGERMNASDVKLFHSYFPEVRFMNHYGPTETTIGSIASFVDLDSIDSCVIIGRPITNTRVYILNKDKQPQPAGIPGEIYITGMGLSRGYHGNSSLTQECFLKLENMGNVTAYKTGDYGKFLQDGQIDYIGRKDRQIKFRGYRVELPEIERNVLNIPGVKQAAVILSDEREDRQSIVCYLVCAETYTKFVIQQLLREKLPEYMIPSDFIYLSKLPINGNGKLDVNELRALSNNEGENQSSWSLPSAVAHDSSVPDVFIAECWSRNLGHNDFEEQDNFFEIGGSSLMLVKIYEELNEEYPGVLNLTDMFNYPNIYKLSSYINEQLHLQSNSV